jgi:DNA mismatch endonuclease, patch repair protein
MADTLSKTERSARMAKVRSKGNQSTEVRVEQGLMECMPLGWVKHPAQVPGRPDFYFERIRLAVFVNGCFWHACPKCGRIPKSRVQFWQTKIEQNRLRDNRVRRSLWRDGYHVFCIWEHQLRDRSWLKRLLTTVGRLGG